MDTWHEDQKTFFAKLDKGSDSLPAAENLGHKTDSDEDVLTDDDMLPDGKRPKKPCVHLSPAAQAWKDSLLRGESSIATELASLEDHTTSILTAAFRALDTGLFTIPGSDGTWNPGQCIGFLLHAYQLQQKHNEDHGTQQSSSSDAHEDAMRFSCVFTGAAGTGKTALLEACDMLTQAVYKTTTCVYRSAPTRTAARLNRGNTCHAAWHLPFGCSLGVEGRLSDATLQKLRKKVEGVHEASIDEISMLSPQKFHQIDSRARSATNKLHLFMGGLKLRLSGDFLQLPPVKAGTFAAPQADVDGAPTSSQTKGKSLGTKPQLRRGNTSKQDDEEADEEYDDAEGTCGLNTFRRISEVVCLTKVVRAPNALGALCTCIRERIITDDVWTLLQSLVIKPDDIRLIEPPFSTTPCKIIVQRHVLRSAMSNEAVLAQAPKMESPVYLVTARDDVETADDGIRSEVQSLLQNEHALRKTGRKPSLLLLYEGARMLLEGKDCRRLGLMNGAEVVVEKIILHDNEHWTQPHFIQPNVWQLKYMPAAVIVRVPDVQWILPPELLGPLNGKASPEDLRGIFIARPDTTRPFRVMLNGIKWKVRRTQLNLIPANAIIVYGAQGESFDSAIVDLGMPPGQTPELFWLACYVMLTRCKDLSGLLFLRLPPRSALTVGPPPDVLAEMERLKSLDVQTRKRLLRNLQRSMQGLPAKITNLFTSGTDSRDVEWPQIHALLAQEVAARQLETAKAGSGPVSDALSKLVREAVSAGTGTALPAPTRRLRKKTAPCAAPASTTSLPEIVEEVSVAAAPCKRRGPIKRKTGEQPRPEPPVPAAEDVHAVPPYAASPLSSGLPASAGSTDASNAVPAVSSAAGSVRRGPLKRKTGQASLASHDDAASETFPPVSSSSQTTSAPVPVDSDPPSTKVILPSVTSIPVSPSSAGSIVPAVASVEVPIRRGPLKLRTGQPSSTSEACSACEEN